MTGILKRLRARLNDPEAWMAADEIERLRAVEALYSAAKDQWNPVYKVVLDDRDRLRVAIERWSTVRKVMMAGSAEGRPWSSQSIAALGLAEAALAQAIEPTT